MDTQYVTSPYQLAGKNVSLALRIRMLLATFFAVDFKRRRMRWLRTGIVVIAVLFSLNAGLYVFAHTNAWLTSRDMVYEGGEFVHPTDERTTAIFAYMTGRGPLPRSELVYLTQQYVKSMYDEAELDVPDNIDDLSDEELRALVQQLYQTRSSRPPSRFDLAFADLMHEVRTDAIRPPLRNISDEDYVSLVRIMERGNWPILRWAGEQRDVTQRLMAASSPRGDSQNFYASFTGVIYFRYNDSLQGFLYESPHAIRFHEEPYLYYLDLGYAIVSPIVQAVAEIPSRSYEIYNERYRNPESFEGEAHRVDGPALLSEFGIEHLNRTAELKPDEEHVCVMPELHND